MRFRFGFVLHRVLNLAGAVGETFLFLAQRIEVLAVFGAGAGAPLDSFYEFELFDHPVDTIFLVTDSSRPVLRQQQREQSVETFFRRGLALDGVLELRAAQRLTGGIQLLQDEHFAALLGGLPQQRGSLRVLVGFDVRQAEQQFLELAVAFRHVLLTIGEDWRCGGRVGSGLAWGGSLGHRWGGDPTRLSQRTAGEDYPGDQPTFSLHPLLARR